MLIVGEMYKMKWSKQDLGFLLAEQLHDFGYRLLIDRHYIWMQPEFKYGGFMYYACVLCYVGDVIYICDYSLLTMRGIK